MPWFKVDDNLAFHAKAVAAGNPAMGLWVRAGSWCSQQLTDGFIPDHMLSALGTKQQAARLVSQKLWDREQTGYRFHEWVERQPTKDDVEAERAAARERMKAYRAKKKGTAQKASPQVNGARSPEPTENFDGSSGEVREVFGNPDPTRPSPSPSPNKDIPRKGRAAKLPPLWQPTQGHKERCVTDGIDLDLQVEKFKAHAEANDRRQVNWNAAFTQWLLSAATWDRGKKTNTATGFPHDGTDAEKDAWVAAQPPATDGAWYGGSSR